MKFDYQEELVDDVSESEGELPPTLDSGDSTGSEFVIGREKNFKFYSDEAEKLYEHVITRPLWNERPLDLNQLIAKKVIELLEEQSYLWTITMAGAYDKDLVYEFYSNMHPSFRDPRSKRFGMSFVRGKILRMHSDALNEILGTPTNDMQRVLDIDAKKICLEFTGGAIPR